MFLVDYNEGRGAQYLGKLEIGQYSVPFDFDGRRFL